MIRQKGDNNLKIAIIQVRDMAGLRIGCKSSRPLFGSPGTDTPWGAIAFKSFATGKI
jgi:hypothetical protein